MGSINDVEERVKQRHKAQSKRHKTSVPMYLWSPLFLAHFGHFLETYTTRKNIFNGGLFLHYPGLKPLLSSLPGVSISPAKPSLENVLARVFTNPRKHQSITEVFYPLVFNIGFKTSVKFCGFKIPG